MGQCCEGLAIADGTECILGIMALNITELGRSFAMCTPYGNDNYSTSLTVPFIYNFNFNYLSKLTHMSNRLFNG